MEELLIAALVAALVSGAVAWVYESVRAYYRRAKLEVASCEHHDDGMTRYFYVAVRNRGKTTARACVPQLTIHIEDVTKVRDGGLVNQASIAGHGKASLTNVATCWQRADKPISVDVHPGQSQRFELASVTSHQGLGKRWIFSLPTEVGYGIRRVVFEGDGFEYLATVGSDNATPVKTFGHVSLIPSGPPEIRLSTEPTAHLEAPTVNPSLFRRLWPKLRRPLRLGPPPDAT